MREAKTVEQIVDAMRLEDTLFGTERMSKWADALLSAHRHALTEALAEPTAKESKQALYDLADGLPSLHNFLANRRRQRSIA